jgi:hypothetical protein
MVEALFSQFDGHLAQQSKEPSLPNAVPQHFA